jgi:hypothetical protein
MYKNLCQPDWPVPQMLSGITMYHPQIGDESVPADF